ncbi:MAG: site-specific integrase [Streptosporangiaceae bacterium]
MWLGWWCRWLAAGCYRDRWEPYRLVDTGGKAVDAAGAYFGHLQAAGRAEPALRSYGMDLQRWFRFVWASGVAWDLATRSEARDFCRWLRRAGRHAASVCVLCGRAGTADHPAGRSAADSTRPWSARAALGAPLAALDPPHPAVSAAAAVGTASTRTGVRSGRCPLFTRRTARAAGRGRAARPPAPLTALRFIMVSFCAHAGFIRTQIPRHLRCRRLPARMVLLIAVPEYSSIGSQTWAAASLPAAGTHGQSEGRAGSGGKCGVADHGVPEHRSPRADVPRMNRLLRSVACASLAHLGSDPAVTGRATEVWSNAVPAPLARCRGVILLESICRPGPA